jgi:hypothetical protein
MLPEVVWGCRYSCGKTKCQERFQETRNNCFFNSTFRSLATILLTFDGLLNVVQDVVDSPE